MLERAGTHTMHDVFGKTKCPNCWSGPPLMLPPQRPALEVVFLEFICIQIRMPRAECPGQRVSVSFLVLCSQFLKGKLSLMRNSLFGGPTDGRTHTNCQKVFAAAAEAMHPQ